MAREAGALLKENFGREQTIEHKGRIDLVTEMDRRSEDLIVKRIQAAFPGDDIWAEEGSGKRTGAERAWVVDPLDGTTNYAHEYPVWSVSIALQVGGDVVAGAVQPLLTRYPHAVCHAERPPAPGERRRHARERHACDRLSYDVAHPSDPRRTTSGRRGF
jgi:myo-inositol-1(or 4)-monophosphatase